MQSRIAFAALAIAVSVVATGCSLLPGSAPTPTPTPDVGYYEDTESGFAITFPGEFTVDPISGNENGAVRASYSTTPDPMSPDGVYFVAGGTTAGESEITPELLEGNLFRFLNAGATNLKEEPIELDGLPAYHGDVTWSDGKPASIVLAGHDHTYYQLIVIGGSAEQRQSFFDTFTLLD